MPMIGALKLSGEDLGNIVAAALGQAGYEVVRVHLFDAEDRPVDIGRIEIDFKAEPIAIRATPDKDTREARMRELLYPDIHKHARDAKQPDNGE